jgi:DNA-binding MarR family transcriptional regulator
MNGVIVGRKDVLPNGKELAVLCTIAELEDELGAPPQQTDVAERYGVTRQAIHYWVKRLRKKNLVEEGPGAGHTMGSLAPPIKITRQGRYFIEASR